MMTAMALPIMVSTARLEKRKPPVHAELAVTWKEHASKTATGVHGTASMKENALRERQGRAEIAEPSYAPPRHHGETAAMKAFVPQVIRKIRHAETAARGREHAV